MILSVDHREGETCGSFGLGKIWVLSANKASLHGLKIMVVAFRCTAAWIEWELTAQAGPSPDAALTALRTHLREVWALGARAPPGQ